MDRLNNKTNMKNQKRKGLTRTEKTVRRNVAKVQREIKARVAATPTAELFSDLGHLMGVGI